MDISYIRTTFFSRETIATLNKQLLTLLNKSNADRSEKKQIIDKLIEQMKSVYKKIDVSKIDETNFSSIFFQFKKYSVGLRLHYLKDTLVRSFFTARKNLDFL